MGPSDRRRRRLSPFGAELLVDGSLLLTGLMLLI